MRSKGDETEMKDMTNTPTDAIEVVAKVLFVMDFGEPDDWDKCAIALFEYCKDATAALTAYHKHLTDTGMVIVPRDKLEAIAAPAYVPLDQLPPHDQPNGWRDIATARIDIARAMIAAQEQGQ